MTGSNRIFLDHLSVHEHKITKYLLNEDHPIGGSKAAFFSSFGFSKDTVEEMRLALAHHPVSNPVVETGRSIYGVKFVVRCRVKTPDGRNPCIVTVWMQEGDDSARLVTAYPA